MKTYPFVLSCDWFAYSCKSTWAHFVNLSKDSKDGDFLFRPIVDESGNKRFIERRVGDVISYNRYEFRVCESAERHMNYQCAVRITYNGIDICHFFYGEKRNQHSTNCIAKVCNSLLYRAGWAQLFLDCLRACGWRIVSVNRLDLCCDFNEFVEGRSPRWFVHDYLSKPTKSRPSFIRRGSNKWRAVGERSLANNAIDTLSWGTRDSPVQVNLYNKSKELEEVHSKPWIIEKWQQNGLKHGQQADGSLAYVWRVEFSLNPSAIAFRSKDRKEIKDFGISMVENQSSLLELFRILLPRYFQFYFIPWKDCPKHVKDLQPVTLFNLDHASNFVPMTLNRTISTGRTERLLSKRLRTIMEGKVFDEKDIEAVGRTCQLLEVHAALNSFKDCAPTTNVLYQFLCQLHPAIKSRVPFMTKEAQERQTARFVKLLMGAKSSDVKDFDAACELLQLEISETMSKLGEIYRDLPDQFYEEQLQDFPSPYDLHIS